MERLASNADDISYLCNYLNRHSNFDGNRFKEIHKKLAEYEDIGLTPEEVKLFLSDFGITVTMRNRELIKERQKNEEIISKMAKRLKAFEENTFNTNWISVNERLPSDEECSKFDNLHPLSRKFLCTIRIGDFNPEPRLLFFSKVFGWKNGADDYNDYVIAWQPLPEPYKEDLHARDN